MAIVCLMSSKGRFLYYGPLHGPPVEMTKAQISITIGIMPRLRSTVSTVRRPP